MSHRIGTKGQSRKKSLKRARSISKCVEAVESRLMYAAHIAGSSVVYPTIQSAVNAAPAGATINVDPGTYDETVYVTEPLTILGANAGVAGTATRGPESIVYATQTVFAVYANDVTISGFTIEGDDANIGAAQGAGVLMEPSIHGTHVLDNIIQDNVDGIYLSNNSNTDECVIQHNLIQNNFETGNNWVTENWNGSREIYTDGTVSGGYLTNVLIDSNTIGNFNFNAGDEDEGLIALQALTAGKQFNIAITNNFITDGSKALLATNVTNLVFMGNTCTALQDGSSGPVRFEGDANNVDIQYNNIDGNVGPGVASDDSGVSGDNSGFVVDNNNIYNNDGIGVITIANLYDGTLYAQNDWWGSASGPSGDGPGTGQAVWANGSSGHYLTPTGAPGGYSVYSPWATALINTAVIPAPAAASALTVSPAAAGQVTLNWTAPSSTATSQLIQRSTNGVNFTTIATVPALLETYTDTGLTAGTTYTYRVITANPTGNGAASNTATAVPPVYQPPEPANGITESSAGPNSIALSWNTPYYPYGIADYTIYRNGTAVGTSTSTSFTDTGLAADTAYTYTITTTDTTGATSSPSAAVSLVTGHSQFLDNSFELTSLSGGYQYDPPAVNWSFAGNAGIEANGSAFGAANAPDGEQAAFIQGINGSAGSFSQSMSVRTTGAYNISLYVAERSGHAAEPVTVSMDGTLLGTFTPASTGFVQVTTNAFALYAGNHTFTFSGTVLNGDADSFVDLVSLNLVGNASVPPAPVLTSVAAASATSTNVSWAPGGFGATSYTLLRSTNGSNWTTVASNLSPTVSQYTDTGLSPLTTYYYELYATNTGIGSSGTSNVMSATTLSSAASITALSSLTPTVATSGYKTVEKNASVNGNTLTLHGTTYATGLGTSAESVITFALGGGYTQFTTDVGIDAEETAAGAVIASVDFQVIGDGKVLYDTGDLGINSPTVHVDVPVAGVQTLTLVATNGIAGIAYDHADWAGAQLFTNPSVPAAPTGLSATAVNTSAIVLTWSPASSNAASGSGYAVDRSTDGVNFTTVATGLSASATSWTDTSVLTPGATYYYRIRTVNAAGSSANSTAASATTFSVAPISTAITTLPWVTATAGYGSVQINQSVGGNPLNLHGVTFSTGLGTHAVSVITYNLSGGYTVFSSSVGIDNEENGVGTGSVDFQVVGDGKLLYDSGILTNASPTDFFAVNVTGVQTLTLLANNGVPGSIDYDHADWAGATLLTTAAQALVAPANLTAAAASTTTVGLTWTSAAPIATGFNVLRSTDGVNFTTLATGLASTARSYIDTTVSAATTYYYKVVALDGSLTSAASNTASTTTLAANAISTNLSTLNWTSATAGYGSVQKNLSVNGNPITLKGVVYPSGLSANAVSDISYNLAGGYTNLLATIGIDDEENGRGTGSVDFQVVGDGKVLFDSGVLTNASPAVDLDVNVTGVQTLTLVANNGVAGTIDYDQADWAGARLISLPQAPAAPASLVAVTSSATRVNLQWSPPPGTVPAAGYLVQRSTDGVNFTTIASPGPAADNFFDTTAAPATTYYYRVLATNSVGTSPASATAAATTLAATAVVTNLSSLNWVTATTGYGSVQTNSTVSGNTITLRGNTYATGIGTHAVSDIVYDLGGAYTALVSDVGVDDEENGKGIGSVDFQVVGDGKVLFDSGVLTNNSPVVSLDVNVTGVQTLTLVATNGVANSIDYDHADWAGARLISPPAASPAASPAAAQAAVSVAQAAVAQAAVAPVPAAATTATTAAAVWSDTLIGGPGQTAAASVQASVSASALTVAAAGTGIGGTADSADFAYQTLTGDGTIVARLQTAPAGGEAGVVIRESADAGARQVALLLAGKSVRFVRRASPDANASSSATRFKNTPPAWVKLVRAGDKFTAYDSADGIHWKAVGSTTVKMNQTVDIGLAASAGNAAPAVFGDVAVTHPATPAATAARTAVKQKNGRKV